MRREYGILLCLVFNLFTYPFDDPTPSNPIKQQIAPDFQEETYAQQT